MVDVVVDAKPMAKLPIDPASIPPAVRKRVEAVEAFYKNGQGNSESGGEQPPPPVVPESSSTAPQSAAPAPQVPPTAEAPSSTPQPPAPAEPIDLPNPLPPRAAAPQPEDENSQSWKRQAHAWQGRYNASQKTMAEMQETMAQMGNELMHAQRVAQPTSTRDRTFTHTPPQPPPVYLTDQDVQNFGGELLDVSQRAALHAVAPHLQRIEGENAELRQRLAVEARRGLDQAVAIAVPNYQEIDNNPRWHNWLLGIDLFSGRVRQQLLNEAIAAASAPRVISFFRGFLQEEAATGHIEPAPGSPQPAAPREPAVNLASLAAPGRARPASGGDIAAVPPEKPTYTRAQIRDMYTAHRKGAFIGREAEWARLDAEIIAAGREGRIRQ